MLAINCTLSDLEEARERINTELYQDNVIWNRPPEFMGRTRQGENKYRFTLRVESSRGPGHRRGMDWEGKGKGRRLPSACWHVHGHFFDALFDIAPDAQIKTSAGDGLKTITANYGNWEDRNIGSMMNPLYFSEACDCYEEGLE